MTETTNSDENDKQQEQKVKYINTPQPVDEVYVDGIAGVIGRSGVFKLDCYRVMGFDKEEKAEVRQLAHRLVLPVTAMNELGNALQQVAQQFNKNVATEKDND